MVGVRNVYVATQLELELPTNYHFIVKKNANFDTSCNMSPWASHETNMDLFVGLIDFCDQWWTFIILSQMSCGFKNVQDQKIKIVKKIVSKKNKVIYFLSLTNKYHI